MSLRIALLRCANKPSFITWDVGNIEDYFDDDRMLLSAFAAKGHDARFVIWSDPSVNWNDFDIVLIRSTWDYIDHHDTFLQVLSRIEASGCKLFNPLEIVRWNTDKIYLLDLQQWGVQIIPTYHATEENLSALQDLFAQKNWAEAIMKPRIGGGASDVHRIMSAQLQEKYAELIRNEADHGFLIQPMISSVISEGEYSYVYIGGKLSYVHLKKPAAGDYRVQGIYGGSLEVIEPVQHDIDQVNEMYARLPYDPLYARIDLVRMNDQLVVMELELIEPILNFGLSPHGIHDFVSAVIHKSHE